MKIKSLLITAAALAAGVMSSRAQVYSQNIVGYVNLSITNGYHLYNNPLDFDGTGTNNTVIGTLGTNFAAGTEVLTWNGSSFSVNLFSVAKHATSATWTTPTAPLNPGAGFFLYNAGSPTNLVVVGTALVGTNYNSNLTGAGYSALGSISPVSGDIYTNLQYSPVLGDEVLLWDDSLQSYDIYLYQLAKHATTPSWSPSSPSLAVGQGFFLLTTNTAPNWTEVLNVQ